MKQLTIRNVGDDLAKALSNEQRIRGTSLNQTVLDLLRRVLGVGPGAAYDNGLGKLAGRWSEDEAKRFDADTAVFEKIDEKHWH